jgi:hypothetical protein
MKRSKHSLSHYNLTTTDMASLVPVGWFEALPGDTIQHRISALLRVSPLVAPVMHPVTVRFHTFFVPNRLIWNTKIGDSGDFEDFITGGPDGNDTQTVPTISSTTAQGDLLDYLGVPNIGGIDVSALPVRAYNLIFNEYFRDQDLVTEATLDSTEVQACAWEKDYFTASRPWTQKGSDVTIPLGSSAPVVTTNTSSSRFAFNILDGNDAERNIIAGSTGAGFEATQIGNDTTDVISGSHLVADLSNATGPDINEWRRAFAIQRYQEARARYGSRYTEYLQYLGINPADARLQRPEYLGGGKQTIAFSEVLQTQRTDTGESPLGTMGGHGISAVRTNRYRRFLQEHGIVMTLMSVRPKSMYSQGIPRKFLRQDKEDFYQRELEQIGEQPVYNDEVYAVNGDRSVFGYQNRYSEYKHEQSRISGEFRSLLNYWHMGREFTEAPALNASFVTCDPTKRIHAEQTQNSLWCMINHSIQARRLVRKSPSSRII